MKGVACMKYIPAIILFLVIYSSANAQKGDSIALRDVDSIYLVYDEPPEFPGGVDSLLKYFSVSYRYPPHENEWQGRVSVSFVINKDGTVFDAKIMRGDIPPEIKKEVLRVLNSMPPWKPGRHKGRIVRVRYTVPFRIK